MLQGRCDRTAGEVRGESCISANFVSCLRIQWMIAKCDTVSASLHQAFTTLGNESVILELQSGTYFKVNDVGAAVWDYLQQPRQVTDVITHIVNKYEVSADQAEAEILSFLQNLVDKGLVVLEHATTR